jgi:hypothetical protein
MTIKSLFRSLAIAGLTCGVILGTLPNATAQERVSWKMQSAWGSQICHLGTAAVQSCACRTVSST